MSDRMGSVFEFKQFKVDQSGCAMKINTDGVLLGALAAHASPKRILDIGTGTGVIALMLAQRFPGAFVEAVEIDEQAADTALRNFRNAVFADRLCAHHSSIERYSSAEKFDLMVSNPPFFVNDLKNAEDRKGIARHANEDFFKVLIEKSAGLLTENGKLWLILPLKQADQLIKMSSGFDLSLSERVNIHSDVGKPAFRQVICLAHEHIEVKERNFYLYESFQEHTLAYKDLLKDFFLAF